MPETQHDHTVGAILAARLPAEAHDAPVPLLEQGPLLVQRLTGERPHKSSLHRWESHGAHGVRLGTLTIAGGRWVTARMLVTYWIEVDAARRTAAQKPDAAKPRTRRRRRQRRARVSS